MNLDIAWWQQLSQPWKNAFAEIFFNHTNEPTPEELARLYASPALRFAGPNAPYANMSFTLTDLSGVKDLVNLQVLVAMYHNIESILELQRLTQLKALYLQGNKIRRINGIENLTLLDQLHLQFNEIESIREVEHLTSLRELYLHDNRLTSLEGLTEAHSDNLKRLVCLPNEGLKQKELMRVERELYIRCHGF